MPPTYLAHSVLINVHEVINQIVKNCRDKKVGSPLIIQACMSMGMVEPYVYYENPIFNPISYGGGGGSKTP